MGLEEIKDDILNEAEEKADEIVKEAEEKRDEIIEEAEEKADEIKEQHREELEEEKEKIEKEAVSNARMKAKQEKLKAKEENLSEAFEQFRERLDNLDEEEKEHYVQDCLDRVEFDVGKVIGGEEFEDAVDTEFEQKDVEGVIVVSEDGARRQDFTFDKIIEQYRNEHRQQVAEKLFQV